MDSAHTSGVLRGERCDDTGSIAVQRSEGLQIRLQQPQSGLTSQKCSANAVLTWIPAPPEGSLPAIVRTAGKAISKAKKIMSAEQLGKQTGRRRR